jgi:hypothetical protein
MSAPAPANANGVLVRADLPQAGAPALLPAYALPAAPIDAPATSEYTIELLDTNGVVLLSQPVTLLQTAAHDEVNGVQREAHRDSHAQQDVPAPIVRSIQAVLPQPAQPVARMRLMQSGTVIAERATTALPSGQSSLITGLQPDANGLLRWGNADRVALVQFTADNGTTWTTLDIDVIGGELQLDPASLPSGQKQFQVILADAVP